MDNSENLFSSSMSSFWRFFMMVNAFTIFIAFIFDRYDFFLYLVTLGIFDLSILFCTFYKKRVEYVKVNEINKEVEISSICCFGKKEINNVSIDEMQIQYREEQVSRATRYRILKVFNKDGGLIFRISPSLLIWDKEKIDKLTKKLLELGVSPD